MRRVNSQAGFTIVEIMIVIMIIGVLSAMVLPSIRTNAVRAKMSEAILALSTCKNVVTEVYLGGGDLPSTGNWGCEGGNVSTYVESITVIDGVITASLRGFNDGRIDTTDITLAPLDNTGNLVPPGGVISSWRCGSPADTKFPVPPQYLPGTCKG